MPMDAVPSSPMQPPEDLQVGVPTLDRQHRQLDCLLWELETALRMEAAAPDLAEQIQMLQALAEEHYETEEAVMAAYGYPHLEPHRAEHEALLERIHSQLHLFLSPEGPPLQTLIAEVRRAFHKHVREVDQEYAAYLRETLGFKALPED